MIAVDAVIYVATAGLAVAWSVWNYFLWGGRAGLAEDSPFRFLNIIGPSAYFLLIVLAGWQHVKSVRLDLVGLVVLDALTVGCVLILAVGM